jgi:signal transduction histidine kinase
MTPRELFLNLARLLPEPMLLVASSGEILGTNSAAEDLLGGGLDGRSLWDLLEGGEPEVKSHLQACRSSGQLLPGSIKMRAASGETVALRAEGARFQPLRDQPPAVAVRLRPKEDALTRFVLLDRQIERLNEEIRVRREAEREVLELNASLEHKVAERTRDLQAANAELDAFASAVSHDLRAPLRAVVATSRMLAEDAADRLNASDLAVLERQAQAALRMGHLVEALLQMARYSRAEVQKQDVDLSRIAEEAAQAVAKEYAHCGASFLVQPGMRACADPNLIRFALDNLLGNAAKFSCPVPEPRIEVGVADGVEQFYVRDNGVGFEQADAERLFEPFERLHGSREFAGTGVGLANVRRILERHGGRVWAEGQPGRGATFYFVLPAQAEAA